MLTGLTASRGKKSFMLQTHVPMLVPRLGLTKAGHTLGLSPAMCFLNENDSFAYFSVLGELSSGFDFNHGIFKVFDFLSILVGFFRGAEGTFLATS